MFAVKNRETGEVAIVYAVAGALFLMYETVGEPCWAWRRMTEYEPVVGNYTL